MSLRARHLWLLALAGLALRGPLLLLSPGAEFDIGSYLRVAELAGPGLYSSVETAGRYPYLPLWWAVLRALKALHGWLGGDFGVWVRVPGVLGDLAVAALVYLIIERRSRSGAMLAAGQGLQSSRAALLAGLAWALNPLAALVSASHGQFDSAALALLLAAAWWLEYSSHSRSELLAALSLGAAIALKTWPLAFLPLYVGVFASRREAGRFALLALAPPLLLLAPWWWMDGSPAILARLSYSGATALGLSGALRASFFAVGAPVQLYHTVDEVWRGVSLTCLGLGFLWLLLNRRRLRLLDALPWVALGLVLFAPGLSAQYLVWPAALALLLNNGSAVRQSIASLLLLLLFYGLFMPEVLAGSAAWPAPRLAPGLLLLWAALNLAWWAWCLNEWQAISRLNLRARSGAAFR